MFLKAQRTFQIERGVLKTVFMRQIAKSHLSAQHLLYRDPE